MTQPRLITFSEHYRTGIRLLYFHYLDILPSNSQMTVMHSPAHQGWVTDSGWRITECLSSQHWLAHPSHSWALCELVLYTHSWAHTCHCLVTRCCPCSDQSQPSMTWHWPIRGEDSSSLYLGPIWSRLAPDNIGNIHLWFLMNGLRRTSWSLSSF